MAKKDAIFDYSSKFDTSPYLTGVQSNWDNSVSNAETIRLEFLWRGTPAAESAIHSESSTAAIGGWDAGSWKMLSLPGIDLELVDDTGVNSWSHKLVYDVKRAFNLPNQEDMSTWKNEYTRDDGELHYLFWQKANITPSMMVMSDSSGGNMIHLDDNSIRCGLIIPISGYDYLGGDANVEKMTVWPTSTDVSAMNTHYKSLEDASTPSADWTNPSKVGTAFTQSSDCYLINYENYWQPTPSPAPTNDCLNFCIGWTTHSYAEIKALIDAAVA